MTDLKSRVEAVKALQARATPGPLEVFVDPHATAMVSTLSIPQHPVALCGPNRANAAFFAHAHHTADLCAELWERVQKLESKLEGNQPAR